MNLSHDWESGVTNAEDVNILTPCKIHTAQTIERLADALEFALAYADTTDQAQQNWQKYAAKRWPHGLNIGQLHDVLTSARALLAEIRGKHA